MIAIQTTLLPIEINSGETVEFYLLSEKIVNITIVSTSAKVIRTTLNKLGENECGARTNKRRNNTKC